MLLNISTLKLEDKAQYDNDLVGEAEQEIVGDFVGQQDRESALERKKSL